MPNDKNVNPAGLLAGLLGAIVGRSLAQYVGALNLLPCMAALILTLVFTKTSFRPRAFPGAIAVTTAHVAWFFCAAVFLGLWGALLEVFAFSLALVALAVRPGMATAAVLGAMQLASLAYNVHAILGEGVEGAQHRALVVHIVLRVWAIVALVVGYQNLRKATTPPEAPVAAAG